MPKKTALALIVLSVLVLAAAANGGGAWIAHKIRVMHGGGGGHR